ncbi:hypothetical protein [Cellulophaga sp. BC115SP]|uniref:hypothetical protein n=1 Tax=Cellulophaga sp. BC115SP TaxID=2683263 RepID=UPI0014129553|nr:hypothetical protein [Cellulophaga sp. BC115SP]NBB31638.1 hypothetical protein [Cellulophaga sp. BC115SP]
MKQFSTMTLRGLDDDENADLVEIMNQVMQKENIKTGQSVFEFILRDYKEKTEELQGLRQTYNAHRHKSNKEIEELQTENKRLKQAIKGFCQFIEVANQLDS